MSQLVLIKGNKYGITIFLDKTAPFSKLEEELKEKLEHSKDFFKNTKLALSFEGRNVTNEEQLRILELIQTHSQLHIVCVFDPKQEDVFHRALEKAGEKPPAQPFFLNTNRTFFTLPASRHLLLDDCLLGNKGQFYKGVLHEGEVMESEQSIVVLGHIEPGAKLIVRGNIVVLGDLNGYAYAGAGGDAGAFIAALRMNTCAMRIGNILYESRTPVFSKEPVMAAVEKKAIFLRSLTV